MNKYIIQAVAALATNVNRFDPVIKPVISNIVIGDIQGRSVVITALISASGFYTTLVASKGITTEYELGQGDNSIIPSDLDSNSVNVLVQFIIEALEFSTTYHIRLEATNENGTTYSDDIEVRTLS